MTPSLYLYSQAALLSNRSGQAEINTFVFFGLMESGCCKSLYVGRVVVVEFFVLVPLLCDYIGFVFTHKISFF